MSRLFLFHQGGLGDFILSLPAILAIVQHHNIPADLWTYARHIPLLKHLPSRLPVTGKSADDPRLAALYRERPEPVFLGQEYALAYVFGRKKNDTFMWNLGLAAGGTVRFISTFPPEGSKVHVSDHQVMVMEHFGIKVIPEYPLFQLNGNNLARADQWLHIHGFKRSPLLCHFGSGSLNKNWPLLNFVRLLEWWETRQGIPGLLIAGPAEEEMIGPPLKIPVARNLPLDLLTALLARSYGYIGNDSGVTHLAAAVGAPTLALFGPTDPEIWAPRGPRVLVLKAGDDMSALTPDYVIQQAEKWYHHL